MKLFKRTLIQLLAVMPIASISFAADFNLNIDKDEPSADKVRQEFLQKLQENQLPLKYYRFLKEHNIKDTKTLMSEEYDLERERLMEEYLKDYVVPYARSSGTISIF